MKDSKWDKFDEQNWKNSSWNISRSRINCFLIRYSYGNILSFWYQNQKIQKPKFIYTYRSTTFLKDLKWDKFILKNRIWLQSSWSKGSHNLIQETDNAKHLNLTESLP
jgi:hypothetical protein